MIVLDTHVWLWWLTDPVKQLRSPMRRSIEKAIHAEKAVLSVLSIWEVASKCALGKLTLPCDVDSFVRDAISDWPSIRIEPLLTEDAIESTRLPGSFHRDPADRIIVALARRLGAKVATVDEAIVRYPYVAKV